MDLTLFSLALRISHSVFESFQNDLSRTAAIVPNIPPIPFANDAGGSGFLIASVGVRSDSIPGMGSILT